VSDAPATAPTTPPERARIPKVLLIVWLVTSAALIALFAEMALQGSSADRSRLAGDLGAVWGALTALLVVPVWKMMKQSMSAPKAGAIVLGVLLAVAIGGGYFGIRSRHKAKLELLFNEAHELGVQGAPKKQRFMRLVGEDTQGWPAYLQRCAELEPAINDYEATELQMDNLLSQMQQEIEELKPKASYANLLPMLTVMRTMLGKDLEAAKVYRKEIEYAKQLSEIPEPDRIRFYNANIQPAVEQEKRIAQDEKEILMDAKARGIQLPENLYREAGIN